MFKLIEKEPKELVDFEESFPPKTTPNYGMLAISAIIKGICFFIVVLLILAFIQLIF